MFACVGVGLVNTIDCAWNASNMSYISQSCVCNFSEMSDLTKNLAIKKLEMEQLALHSHGLRHAVPQVLSTAKPMALSETLDGTQVASPVPAPHAALIHGMSFGRLSAAGFNLVAMPSYVQSPKYLGGKWR